MVPQRTAGGSDPAPIRGREDGLAEARGASVEGGGDVHAPGADRRLRSSDGGARLTRRLVPERQAGPGGAAALMAAVRRRFRAPPVVSSRPRRPDAGYPGLPQPQAMPLLRLALRGGVISAALLALGGCDTLASLNPFGASGPQPGTPGFVRGFLGGVAAEDPAAALAARTVLAAGGSAVDAAVAAGFTMAVTLPSRVGLGGGGACLVFDPAKGAVEAVLFPAGPRSVVPAGADRPAATPLLARGLFALHTRLPRRPFEELIATAEQTARFGTEVSRALADDLAAIAGPLFSDPGARGVFGRPDGQPRAAGEPLVQPELAATLGSLRVTGVGDLHQGTLARRLEEASQSAGGMLTIDELRAALPALVAPIVLASRGGDRIAFLPPPADGGLAAAASWAALQSGQSASEAEARGLAVAAAWRLGGGEATALLATAQPPAAGLEVLPASAGLMVFDRNGAAVACAFSLNNLFGTGRMAPGLGFLLAAAPNTGTVRPALLSAALAYNPNLRAFRFAAAGSGQQAAPMAVAWPAAQHLLRGVAPADTLAQGVPAEGRTQLGACLNYLPGRVDLCLALTDPRGRGVALGTVDR
jgi:gamma-glutamyltranspeptidase/glutathione hydrolase